jgi:hypothetical protein
LPSKQALLAGHRGDELEKQKEFIDSSPTPLENIPEFPLGGFGFQEFDSPVPRIHKPMRPASRMRTY